MAQAGGSLAESRWSDVVSSGSNASQDAPSSQTSQESQANISECPLYDQEADIQTIATYFAQSKAPEEVYKAFDRVCDASRRVDKTITEQAIRQLQAAVSKLSTQVEKTNTQRRAEGTPASYAAVASQGTPTQQSRTLQSRLANEAIPMKPVPGRHRREVIAVRGTETMAQKNRSYKELIEQLNTAAAAGKAVAIRQLPSKDLVITMESEQARNEWIKNTEWLSALGEGARVKRREFAVMAHGIRVAQIQGQTQAIEAIYEQNANLRGTVEILRVAFTKRLLRTERTTGPLIISVAEPEQANRLIDAGLIWQYELHDCEPFEGNCVITQCFKCFQYGHLAKHCRNAGRCGFCGAPGHATNDCLGKEEKAMHRCIPCRGNHPSWARECPVRAKQAETARRAYNTRPARYQSSAGTQANRQRTPTASQAGEPKSTTVNLEEPTPAIDHPLEEWQEPWIEVRSKRTPSPRSTSAPPAKRPRGRPLGSTKASRNTMDIRGFANTQ